MEARTARVELCYDNYKQDIKSTLRACIATSIAISQVVNALKKKTVSSLKVEVTGEYHPWWLVPKISAS
jgi:hypothetical protein